MTSLGGGGRFRLSRVWGSRVKDEDRDNLSCSMLLRGRAGRGGVLVASDRLVLLRARSKLTRSTFGLALGGITLDAPCEFLVTAAGLF